jgi:ceramide glucosyltransferase
MLVEVSLTLLGFGLLLQAWALYLELAAAIVPEDTPGEPEEYPSVTVIRPIKGLDAGIKENLRAALNPGYPGDVETIFVFDDEQEPALTVLNELLEEGVGDTGTARILFCGAPPPHRTGKLNAMILALPQAKGELIAFADSDTRTDQDTLKKVVATLVSASNAGSAFAPVVVASQPESLGDAGYALLLNGLYGPAAALSAKKAKGEMPFIMGQFMVFRREALDAIGGLECAEGQLVDDMYLGARVKGAGYRNMVAPVSLPIIEQGLSLADFAGVFLRWIAFSRTGLTGWTFKRIPWIQALLFWIAMLSSVIAIAQGFWLALILNACVVVSVVGNLNRLHFALGGSRIRPRYAWVAGGLMLCGPAFLAMTMLFHRVTWRGRSYELDSHSRLRGGGVK